MAKYTPGPWETVGATVRTQRTLESGGFFVAECYVLGCPEDAERRANARLIAAAPDLLAQLKRMANDFCTQCGGCMGGEEMCPEMAPVWAAIARADGTENGGNVDER